MRSIRGPFTTQACRTFVDYVNSTLGKLTPTVSVFIHKLVIVSIFDYNLFFSVCIYTYNNVGISETYQSLSYQSLMFCFYLDDHSRVVLELIDGKPNSDYINASHIDVSSTLYLFYQVTD